VVTCYSPVYSLCVFFLFFVFSILVLNSLCSRRYCSCFSLNMHVQTNKNVLNDEEDVACLCGIGYDTV
jgi:hypothetical protein